MRNKLYIGFTGGNWLYFSTNHDDLTEAYKEYQELLERIGINDNDMTEIKLEIVRNYDGEIIDWDEKDTNGEWKRYIY